MRRKKSTELPRSVVEAACKDEVATVRAWLDERSNDVNATLKLPDLLVGANVEARFHGGDECTVLSITACLHLLMLHLEQLRSFSRSLQHCPF